ncbi:expressed unknown protein [Seminavis robusta]|uniref:Uncharacterized protein n=1 Tax=Seminavis robusta TaxID=568900 RepID=A0A9N8DB61_9STRA|nr:expressed unknown protein [Seminavis robusta]|eukprot:Sro21_g014810.1 n/a (117) ;mRNA; r:107035-107385
MPLKKMVPLIDLTKHESVESLGAGDPQDPEQPPLMPEPPMAERRRSVQFTIEEREAMTKDENGPCCTKFRIWLMLVILLIVGTVTFWVVCVNGSCTEEEHKQEHHHELDCGYEWCS